MTHDHIKDALQTFFSSVIKKMVNDKRVIHQYFYS